MPAVEGMLALPGPTVVSETGLEPLPEKMGEKAQGCELYTCQTLAGAPGLGQVHGQRAQQDHAVPHHAGQDRNGDDWRSKCSRQRVSDPGEDKINHAVRVRPRSTDKLQGKQES